MTTRESTRDFKGSTTARFVKKTVKSEFRRKAPEQLLGTDNSPMGNDAILRKEMVEKIDALDTIMGFDRVEHGENDGERPRIGWLINMHATTVPGDEGTNSGYSAVDYYFLDEEGGSFKATYRYSPYFFVEVIPGHEPEVEEWLRKALESANLKLLCRVTKEDLKLPNHLVGLKKTLIQLNFHNVQDLLGARRILSPIIADNQLKRDTREMYLMMNFHNTNNVGGTEISMDERGEAADPATYIQEMKEYDVPYHVRVSIDNGVRVGKWYKVYAKHSEVTMEEDTEKLAFADPVVLAFDIETTKAPLKFPNAQVDQIMMISYMIDGEGFLITNREIISEDIEDFEYTPKPEYPGMFTIFNERDEKHVLMRFYEHIRDVRPTVIATFNGDFFDWPFVETRTRFHDMDMFEEIGFAKDNEGEYKSKYCVHMDCYRWVKRDSYLPQGSQGLKAVTTAKLGYNPTELDPELMTPYAYDKPQLLAEYSVSDAVATYYLYYKYVHPFIFSLCTIIPLNPDEVLRKGTGTLCEMLLLVKAYEGNILLPNKHKEPIERFYNGHLLESETYVGGHVESLEAGVFRSDIACDFTVDTTAVDELLGNLHKTMKFCIEVENKTEVADVENYDEVYEQIASQLRDLSENPVRREDPLIYHVDVASMYPNIMTSNRLQPDSMKSEEDCAACDFNRPGKTCDRRLPWAWRGEFFPAEMSEYGMIKRSLQNERFPNPKPWLAPRTFDELPYAEQATLIKKRLSDYGKKVYHRIKQSEVVTREAIICQRENPFYVDTVRSFRDRRYEFKGLAKEWKGKVGRMDLGSADADAARKMVVLYDSLQLAHKVILNSFYGYVMRKGSRWFSMEMAGVTCLTGAHIIQMARKLVERLGRPLELDTDGIWCILPKTFPENFTLRTKNGRKMTLEFPCLMLNYLVHEQFTNHQYQTLEDARKLRYSTRSENSIFFEVDGPYKAMVLPTSKEEGKNLKKRYAVFNHDGSLAELKGFELKRRGELGLIKTFQADIFKLFLMGDTLETCYGAVASVANNWLDVMETRGGSLGDDDLVELLCENRSMSKLLAEYGDQKLTSITTARRLGEFLGEEMVKDAGLATKYIISAKPVGAPVTERAVPVSIFSLDKKEFFLRKWLKDPSLDRFAPRDVIDWAYYSERLASVVQKIISIPAALQNVPNPVPRVAHPDWLQRQIRRKEDTKQQTTLSSFFQPASATQTRIQDIEDFGDVAANAPRTKVAKVTARKRRTPAEDTENDDRAMAVLNGPCPSMTEDYAGFLAYQKAKWHAQTKQRAQRRQLFGANADTASRSTVGGILRKQAESVAGTDWEILQYKADAARPGHVKVHAQVGGKLHTFTFRVPKKVYAAYKHAPALRSMAAGVEMEASAAVLPNGHDASHLYRITMPEEVYNTEATNLSGVLQDPGLLAVYETQISAVERMVVEMGNVVRFDDTRVGALGRGLRHGFAVRELARVEKPDYLRRLDTWIVYVLHVVTNGYEMFVMYAAWDARATVYVLKPSASAQEVRANFSRLYREAHSAKRSKLDEHRRIIEYPEEMEFDTVHFSDRAKLMKKLNTALAHAHEARSNCILAVQSPRTATLVAELGAAADMPTVQMKVREFSVPAVGWQALVARRVVNHVLALVSWMQNLVALAQYGGVPLCNLEVDNVGYLIDVAYARRLVSNNIVMWWCDAPHADHGGFEMDAARAGATLEFPTVNRPEVYETACLEVELGTLTINSILTSSLINEAEGADLADDSVAFDANNGAQIMADDTFSPPALAVLRAMVKNWWDDALTSGNINADAMMQNLVAWVQSPSSRLYDPALHYHVHNATTKALLQLMGEFRRMNAHVIHASRNRILLETTKISVENSYAYGQYILRAARSKPLFNFLDLSIVRYWDVLVWMDEYNYGGRCCTHISDAAPELELVNHWQIKEFLPSVVEREFEDYVVVFLDALTKEKDGDQEIESLESGNRGDLISQVLNGKTGSKTEGSNGKTSNGTQGSNGKTEALFTPTQILNGSASNGNGLVEEHVDDAVTESFRKPLHKTVLRLYKLQNNTIINPELADAYRFPKRAGSHLVMRNPTLEMVKFLCAIFGLSKRRSIAVRLLRKELLGIFEVREFSDEATFRNPSASLKIPHVACDYCNHIRDIDMCRDDEAHIWACVKCSKPYSRVRIEEELISQYHKVLATFYSQDYQCAKCHQIRSSNLSLFCKCSGAWVETVSYVDVERKLNVFARVADYYNLQLLREMIEGEAK